MKRERITIMVQVDTDPVPGWGNDPNDYVKFLENHLNRTIPHYNPEVRLIERSDGNTTFSMVLDHAHHSPFEAHLFPLCPWCNPSFPVGTTDQEIATPSS